MPAAGKAGNDLLRGGGVADTFMLRRYETAGDVILDVSGNDGDAIRFGGFGESAKVACIGGAVGTVPGASGPPEELVPGTAASPGSADFIPA